MDNNKNVNINVAIACIKDEILDCIDSDTNYREIWYWNINEKIEVFTKKSGHSKIGWNLVNAYLNLKKYLEEK